MLKNMHKSPLIDSLIKSENPHDIYNQLKLIQYLLLKYGKKIQNNKFLEGIKEINTGIYELIIILQNYKQLEIKKLSNLIRQIDTKLGEKISSFEIKSNSENVKNEIDGILNTKFEKHNLSFRQNEKNNISLEVKGAGYSFKRSLEGDLEKLLK